MNYTKAKQQQEEKEQQEESALLNMQYETMLKELKIKVLK